MVVGAWCRDILHRTLSHAFSTAATKDLDLALALSSWDAYRALAASFRRIGNTGIRFRIAGENVDLLPFGSVEDPDGVVSPPSRDEPFSVWAFEEILAWYAESTDVHDRLYDTPTGNALLTAEDADLPLAAAHLLGTDVAATIGPRRRDEVLARWPGDTDLLVRELRLHGSPNWPSEARRRAALIAALTRGLSG